MGTPHPARKKDATKAMGTTNDATIYHGRIMLTMKAPEIKDYLQKIPSNKSKGYGKPFYEISRKPSLTLSRSTLRSSSGRGYHQRAH